MEEDLKQLSVQSLETLLRRLLDARAEAREERDVQAEKKSKKHAVFSVVDICEGRLRWGDGGISGWGRYCGGRSLGSDQGSSSYGLRECVLAGVERRGARASVGVFTCVSTLLKKFGTTLRKEVTRSEKSKPRKYRAFRDLIVI